MGKKLRKVLASCLALSMCMSMLSVSASAAETAGTVKVETSGGHYENVDVVITIEKDGNTENKSSEAENFVTDDGVVNYEDTSSMTTDQNNVTTGESESEYTVDDGDYHAVGGSETTIEKGDGAEGVSDITVDVPLTSEDKPETETTENQNTVEKVTSEKVTGDPKEYPEDGVYDYTTTTTSSQVTITTNEITVTETPVEKVVDENGNVVSGTDLEYVVSQAKPVQDDATTDQNEDNELFIWLYKGETTQLPAEGEKIEVKDGYEYKYLGAGNSSQYLPVYLYGTPAYEGEEPVYEDAEGNEYYVHDQGFKDYNESYVGGERVDLENSKPGTFSVAQQFILVDAATGELITAYCADAETPTQKGFNYFIENLEDADYYKDEQAAMIRTIAENGYWGAEAGEDGSLENMKKMMSDAKDKDGNPVFTAEEVEQLTDGLALSVTQMAIWTFSNKNAGIEFFSSLYTKDGNKNGEVTTSYASRLVNSNAQKEDSYELMYKLYDYMINMAPTSYEGNKTTSNTIINADNFLKDMSVTVIEKDEDHDNNKDDDDNNDAYVTDLSFALVVTPDEDGDDLVVKVLAEDGSVLASGRIAGENKEGEDYTELEADENGNYTFKNIVMVEGNTNFNITLEGIQNLEEGVYLYTSEVVADEEGETSSQTLVGIAGGEHAVNVSMNLNFELSVEDEVVVTERVWRDEWVDSNPPSGGENPPSGGENPPEEFTEIPEEDIPLVDVEQDEIVELPEEEIPLADVPKTGDASAMWMLMSALSGSGLLGLAVLEKKRKED